MKVDPKVAFYLKHQKQINEWSACKERVAAEAQRFYASLATPLEKLRPSLPGEPLLWSHTQSWSRLMLYRERWIEPGKHVPDLAIGIEWSQQKTTFENAYLGIERQCDSDRAKRIANKLLPLSTPSARENGYSQGAIWPIWCYAKPPLPNYWENLEALHTYLVDRIRQLWMDHYLAVDSLYDVL